MLEVHELEAGYGAGRVLEGVSLQVRRGEIVALLGRNGAGRSTLLRCLMGLLPTRAGQVTWGEHRLTGLATHRIARLGVGYLPESRDIFPLLTVRQNLELGLQRGRAGWTEADAFAAFGSLASRADVPGGALSGGEQQMLALCRMLMARPELLLLDEPTEGLAPSMAARVAECLRDERQAGRAVLLVEQKQAISLDIADRVLVMGRGRIVFEGTPAALRRDAAVQQTWLQV
ncbi:ABC transporter ATP-binding protein [Xylophilus sp. GOD-11R]|uniref:ABC transporter ATP-binding protein n=1 Tax=Xylophilus sp. GOD-11R TaxID=3089814 RepID=UPI00298C70EE|nr:ABC transporter ATP-binding protein [Xylophilus sp. GOD-11R]WPB59258.1 ABC transporter ATP-binding protein [Xylophilus sp. GOD-11R]